MALAVNAQSDLDAFMEKVLARRDDNWKKLQQYVLDEEEKFDLTGPGGFPLWGMRREYTWFIRQGIFVRSPVTADGVSCRTPIGARPRSSGCAASATAKRTRSAAPSARAKGEEVKDPDKHIAIGPTGVDVGTSDDNAPVVPITNTDDMLKQMREPQFVSSAYFLKFRFEKGHYALAAARRSATSRRSRSSTTRRRASSRTAAAGPTGTRQEGRGRFEEKMNKASMVTLWIDPADPPDPAVRVRRHGLGLLPRPRAGARQRRAGDDADGAGVPERLAAGQHRDGIRR